MVVIEAIDFIIILVDTFSASSSIGLFFFLFVLIKKRFSELSNRKTKCLFDYL